MATVPSSMSPPFVTLSHVVAALPDIPLSRIRLSPLPGTATEADVIAARGKDKSLCELIDGVLVEKAIGAYESWLAGEILAILREFALKYDLGVVFGEAGMLQLFPGQVRIPDTCFISWSQLPGRMLPREAVPALHPDLAVEVLSQSNTRAEMQRKLNDYFQAGTRLVWYLDPERREMTVLRSPVEMSVVAFEGVLDGGDVLPGLQLPVAQIFRVPRFNEQSGS